MTTPTATPLSVPVTAAGGAMQGRFLWYELMTPDPEAAQKFYRTVLGWSTQPFEQAEGSAEEPYTMWVANGKPIGGCMKLTDEMRERHVPPHWMAYIGADDIDATVTKAKSLGAQVYVETFEIPTVGRMAVLADPLGAPFAVYQRATAPDPEEAAKVGEFSWHELMTTDYKAAFDFYQALFGWELASDMDMGELGVYRLYARNGRQLGGMFNKPPEMAQVPPHFQLYVRVDDVNAAAERVKGNGGQIANGPMEVPGGDWVANCFDPQGAAFSLHQTKQ